VSDYYSNSPYGESACTPKSLLEGEQPAASLPAQAAPEGLETRLSTQLAELETRLTADVAKLRSGCGEMWQRLDQLQAELRAALPALHEEQRAEAERRDLFREVWEGAALPVRLAFEQVALAREHPLQGALREAAALVDLWRKGGELESWVSGYPVLFLEAWEKLSPAVDATSGAAELLARETLAEVRSLLENTLRARGIEWVAPRPGEPVNEAHTVVGEVSAPGVGEGRVARSVRPGLRRGGTLLIPAQVYRQTAGAAPTEPAQPAALSQPTTPFTSQASSPPPVTATPTADPVPTAPVAPPPVSAASTERPEWLRELERRGAGAAGPHGPVMEALRVLAAPESSTLADDALGSVIAPLLTALGPARGVTLEGAPEPWRQAWESALPQLAPWLETRGGLSLVAPEERAPFLAEQMEATDSRRTAHPHEDNTVARLERVGMLRQGRVLHPARVIRYEAGVRQ
jgi:molecular chaperone GrpE (heat shock protein)